MQQLTCPNCRLAIPVDDVELATELAKCRACQTVFSFRSQIARPPAAPAPVGSPRPVAPPPSRFRIDDYGSTFRVRWRWFTWEVIFLTFFCAFWDGFLVFWYSIGIANGAQILMFVFPILHVAVGVVLTYHVLTTYVNSTVVALDGGQFTVRHGPLPWWGAVSRPTTDLKQLYVRERRINRRKSRRIHFDLHAVLADGGDARLVADLRDYSEALFLEQQIESRLRIADERVGGEYEP